ncbi:B22R family protein [Pigeonpox virus]|uniref:B22R family protein n=1 Tax=Pigeonpox virus TaxID=10264 RepID=A0A068EE75_9POXV|nr:B22R family protein [Pigeonpox virus]AID46609.1 B22R family protein [Pigeonpox virus]
MSVRVYITMTFKIPWCLYITTILILISVSEGYRSCARKSGLYHDTGMLVQDDTIDRKSSATFRYLKIAEKKEQSRLLNSFNWTKIKEDVRSEFNRSCNLGNGKYAYNYTIVFEATIGKDSVTESTTPESPTTAAVTTNDSVTDNGTFITIIPTTVSPSVETTSSPINYSSSDYDEAMKFLTSVLDVNETTVEAFMYSNDSLIMLGNINATINKSEENNPNTLKGNTKILQYTNCNNVTANKVEFSIHNITNGTKVKVSLLGVNTGDGSNINSEELIQCISKNIDNDTVYTHQVVSGCEECSMKFMASVTPVSVDFNNTMNEIGIEMDNSTDSFYLCNLEEGDNCMEFIDLSSIAVGKTVEILKHSNLNNTTHSRHRRSIILETESSSMEEFDCRYLHYPDVDEMASCNAKIRNRRSDKEPKKEKDPGFVDNARKHLGNKPIIPPRASHLQVGIQQKRESGVTGDGAIYSEVKKKAKNIVYSIAPSLPSTRKPEDLYATVRKPPKLPPKLKSDVFTEALRETIGQKQKSISDVLYAELEFSSHRPPKNKHVPSIYSRIDFSRRTSVSSVDSEPDFEDIEEVKRQLQALRLGSTQSRSHSSTSSSDFEYPPPPRRSSSTSSDFEYPPPPRRSSSTSSDFEYPPPPLKDRIQMKKGTTSLDPAGNTITKRLKNIGGVLKGVNIIKQPPSPYSPTLVKGVDTGTVLTTPLTRKGAIRRRLDSDKTQLGSGIQFSPAKSPQLDNEIYMEGPTNGKPNNMFPPNRPLPPPPVPPHGPPPLPPRDMSRRPLPAIPEDLNPKSGAIPKNLHRRCRRSLDGVVCGMLQSKPKLESTYSLAGSPTSSPYSLAGKSEPPLYEEIGGIPKEKVNVVDKSTITRGTDSYENSKSSGGYKGSMKKISSSLDKSLIFGGAMLMAGQQAAQHQVRQSVIQRKDSMSKEEKVFEAVTISLSTLGTTLTSAGLAGGPKLMIAGMAVTAITGIIDTVKDIFYLFSGIERPKDPLIKLLDTYSGLINDREKSGVRKCMVPGDSMMIYMAYQNDTRSFKPEKEITELYFLDTINSELLYMNTSDIILDYQLRVACPIGVLRSPDTDITAYTIMYDDGEVKKYMFTRLGVLLSRTPVVRLTCGRVTTLTIRPYEVPISSMQLLKMATPGEPKSTRSIPSDVCDKYPLKKFYLLADGCPYDTSQTMIVHTTCGILLKMSTWDPFRNRWVLKNPFRQEGEFKQLFTFSKYDFNDTIIDPNGVPGHSDFCTNKQSSQCYWAESMMLEDVTSCQTRVRKIYVKIALFGDRGFDSFVLTCPSGSTPVSIDGNDKIIELPVGDYGTSKLFASIEKKRIGVFCMHNYDTRYKSDIIIILFEKNSHPRGVYKANYNDRDRLFTSLSAAMPYRSRSCDNRRQECYFGDIDFTNPDVELEIHHSSKEIMLKESYDMESIDPDVIEKSKTGFPTAIKVTFTVNNLGNAYKNPSRFWKDAINKKRTYSTILINLVPCTSRNKDIKFGNIISTMGYLQSQTGDYGDGKHYYFKRVGTYYGGNCQAELDLNSRDITVSCDPFSIPRANVVNYEGLCFAVVTSKDHCATEKEWMKNHGYTIKHSTYARACRKRTAFYYTPTDYYCGYNGDIYDYFPDYDACKSYIHIEYKDIWIESDVLQSPPYTFEFTYNSNNEYVSKELSDRMNELYEEYKKLIEYTDGTLPKSINRLAMALTKEGREITSVNVDGNILELAYQADKEKIMEIQDRISEITNEIFIHTLTDEDLKEIMEAAENDRCCIIDVHNNRTEKYYPIDKYICGEVSDYVYTDEEERKYVLINDTYIPYEYLNQSGAIVTTCYNISIIPLDTKESRKIAEDAIIYNALSDALNEIFDEMDANISLALISDESDYIESSSSNILIVSLALVAISLITVLLIIICSCFWVKRSKKYNILKTAHIQEHIELDNESYSSFSG